MFLNTTIYRHQQSEICSYISCFVKKYPPIIEITDISIYIVLKSHISPINYTIEVYLYNFLEKNVSDSFYMVEL